MVRVMSRNAIFLHFLFLTGLVAFGHRISKSVSRILLKFWLHVLDTISYALSRAFPDIFIGLGFGAPCFFYFMVKFGLIYKKNHIDLNIQDQTKSR